MGDRILRQVAERLNAGASQGDVVARVGGDEFAEFVPRMNDPEDAVEIAQRINESLKPAFEIDGRELFVTASHKLCYRDSYRAACHFRHFAGSGRPPLSSRTISI